MATLKEIARLCNVSVSTVSKVLNGKGRVGESKRRKILKVAKEIGYTPNYHARRMVEKSKILTIGLIVPDISNPFFSTLTRGIEKTCGENVLVILMDSFRNLEREEKLIKNARFRGIDGLIIGNSRVNDDLVLEISRYIPIVVFDKDYELKNTVSIILDNKHGARLATTHLIKNGCRKIVHLSGTSELYVSVQRIEGYTLAMKENNLEPKVYLTGYDEKSGYKKMKELLSKNEKFDGVFCVNDLVAIGAIKALKENNMRIPEDVSIVGFDNDEELCEIITPSLTSIHQPVEEMGEIAARSLINLIENGDSKIKKYVFSPRLVIRESSIRNRGEYSV